MDQFEDSDESCMLIVATDNWRNRIISELSGSECKMLWSANVYEAAAMALKPKSHNGSISALLVMIDCLTAEEMRIFGCLNDIIPIRTIAVSAAKNKDKMSQAKQYGADDVVELSELSKVAEFRLKPPCDNQNQPESTVSEQVRETTEDIVQEQNNDMQSKTPTRPERKPPVKEKTTARPMLSQDELDALLG